MFIRSNEILFIPLNEVLFRLVYEVQFIHLNAILFIQLNEVLFRLVNEVQFTQLNEVRQLIRDSSFNVFFSLSELPGRQGVTLRYSGPFTS